MAKKYSSTECDRDLRERIFKAIAEGNIELTKINDRQYGIILEDLNGTSRYIRIGAIVAKEREDVTAKELMKEEIEEYIATQKEKAKRKAENEEKAKRDKEERARRAKEKEE